MMSVDGGKAESPMMTTEEAAKAIRSRPRTIRSWIDKGLIPRHCYAQIGRGPRKFVRVAVEYYKASGEWPPTLEVQLDWALKMKSAA